MYIQLFFGLHQVSKFNSLKVFIKNEIDGFQFRVFVERNSAFLKYSLGTSLPLINTNTNYYSISNDVTKQLSNPVYIISVLVDISMYFCLLLPVSKIYILLWLLNKMEKIYWSEIVFHS